jgi:hypothetical protein
MSDKRKIHDWTPEYKVGADPAAPDGEINTIHAPNTVSATVKVGRRWITKIEELPDDPDLREQVRQAVERFRQDMERAVEDALFYVRPSVIEVRAEPVKDEVLLLGSGEESEDG